jgi:tetratricopeptide (TPR) repeat protein
MSDPQRSDPAPAPGSPADADRHLRIEQLLLSGLDHYFSGEYEEAINVWTRVVFLERGHDRARAYIERARSALAERHRESEELLHRGVAAYNAGEVGEARELLTRAIEQGGPSDIALVFLERLSRLQVQPARIESPVPSAGRDPFPVPPAASIPSRGRWVIVGCLACSLVAGLLFSGLPVAWITGFPDEAPAGAVQPAPEPLPIGRPSEIALDRARTLYENGRLKDALRTLDRIGMADPLRPEADRLLADVQRELVAASAPDAGQHP